MEHRSSGSSARYLTTVFAIGIVASLAQAATPLVVDGLVKYARFSLADAGLCASIETFGQCAGTAAALLLIRRHSPRPLVTVGLILTILGNLLSARIIGFGEFAAARLIAGSGCGLLIIFSVLIARTARPQRYFAIFTGLLVVGSAGLSVAMPWLLEAGGVSAAYLTIAALAAACLFSVAVIPNDGSSNFRSSLQGASASHVTISWRRIIHAVSRNPHATLVCTMVAIYSVSWSAIWTYLGAFGPSHGMSDNDVAVAISVAWLVGGTLGAAMCAWTEGRVHLRHSLIAQLGAVAAFVVFVGCTKSPTAYWLSAGMFVFLTNMCYASFMSLLADIDPSGQLVTAGSLIQLLAFVAGPAIGAVLVDAGSFTGLQIFGAVGLLLAAACLVRPGPTRNQLVLK
jgi:predicted MFS family arabinose efflux permease